MVFHNSHCILGVPLCPPSIAHCEAILDHIMPGPYSQDLRWRVIWSVWNLGHTTEETAVYLGISTRTVRRYPTRLWETGSVHANNLGRPVGTLKFRPHEELLVLETILRNPDKTYGEILDEVYRSTGSEFACSTLHYYFRRSGITRKQVCRYCSKCHLCLKVWITYKDKCFPGTQSGVTTQ